MRTAVSRWCAVAFLAGLAGGSGVAHAACTFNGQPINLSVVCDFFTCFDNGATCADLDDGSGSGTPDGGVDLNDLNYFLTCLGSGLPNDNCTTPVTITGFGEFSYFTCGIISLPVPTTGAGGQNNAGGGICNVTWSSAIPNDEWFLWTAPAGSGWTLVNTVALTGNPTLTTDDTRIAVYGFTTANTGVPPCPTGAGGPYGGTALAYSDDSGGVNNKQARVAFQAIPGNRYLIQLGGVAPCGGQTQCRKFEILDLSGFAPQNFGGFPGTVNSIQLIAPFAFITAAAVPVVNCVFVPPVPACFPAQPRRCYNFTSTPTPLPQTGHIVVRVRYNGVPLLARRRLLLWHMPIAGTNANTWVNARCSNQNIGFASGILTGVIDSFSPFSIMEVGCRADIDEDGGVTIDDLLLYLQLFDDGNPAADLDDGSGTGFADEGLTIDDLLYYLFVFDRGC